VTWRGIPLGEETVFAALARREIPRIDSIIEESKGERLADYSGNVADSASLVGPADLSVNRATIT